MNTQETLRSRLKHLSDLSETLWAHYLAKGPGAFSDNAFTPVVQSIRDVEQALDTQNPNVPSAWLSTWHATTAELALLQRAVERSEGLCFVTGEAGLIPQQDLCERCERAIRKLRELTAQL